MNKSDQWFHATNLPILYSQLHRSDMLAQRAFCARCYEQLFGYYEMYHQLTGNGAPKVFRTAINLLWHPQVSNITVDAINTIQEQLKIELDDRLIWSQLAWYAFEAIQAGLSLIHPLYRIDAVTITGTNVLKATYEYIWWLTLPLFDEAKRDPDTMTKFGDWITSSPLLQIESDQQAQAIELLLREGATQKVLSTLRSQSQIGGVQLMNRRIILAPLPESNNEIPF